MKFAVRHPRAIVLRHFCIGSEKRYLCNFQTRRSELQLWTRLLIVDSCAVRKYLFFSLSLETQSFHSGVNTHARTRVHRVNVFQSFRAPHNLSRLSRLANKGNKRSRRENNVSFNVTRPFGAEINGGGGTLALVITLSTDSFERRCARLSRTRLRFVRTYRAWFLHAAYRSSA